MARMPRSSLLWQISRRRKAGPQLSRKSESVSVEATCAAMAWRHLLWKSVWFDCMHKLFPVLLGAAVVSCLRTALGMHHQRVSTVLILLCTCRHAGGLSVTASNLSEVEDPAANIMCVWVLMSRCTRFTCRARVCRAKAATLRTLVCSLVSAFV